MVWPSIGPACRRQMVAAFTTSFLRQSEPSQGNDSGDCTQLDNIARNMQYLFGSISAKCCSQRSILFWNSLSRRWVHQLDVLQVHRLHVWVRVWEGDLGDRKIHHDWKALCSAGATSYVSLPEFVNCTSPPMAINSIFLRADSATIRAE